MADQGRWFKVWTNSPEDPDLENLDVSDFGRWTKLGCRVKAHGRNGSITFAPPSRGLCAALQVSDFDALVEALRRLPHLDVEPNGSGVRVRFRNWNKYQEDSTAVARLKRWREKQKEDGNDVPPVSGADAETAVRREEKRREDQDQDQKRGKSCPECERGSEALRSLSGKDFGTRTCSDAGLHARHKEHGIEAVLRVIRIVGGRLLSNESTAIYCRPKTLFGPKNFGNYLHESEVSRGREGKAEQLSRREEPDTIESLTIRIEGLTKAAKRFRSEGNDATHIDQMIELAKDKLARMKGEQG